jgi:hypothetical protein
MATAVVELDKTWSSEARDSLGTIEIRVVVLKNKPSDESSPKAQQVPADLDDEEPIFDFGKTPLDSYLERRKGGRLCAVFLVNGQRHDAWDNTYLVRDLGFKYLRNRTMLIVDLDGLAPEALARLIQGSRQGFFKGEVFDAIRDRIFATLKDDPDLKRLQVEAEQEIAELESGDEVVKGKLDQLIEDHHNAAIHAAMGDAQPGQGESDQAKVFGSDKKQNVVVADQPDVGTAAEYPVFANPPSSGSIRLIPDEPRTFNAHIRPVEKWQDVEALDVRTAPILKELSVTVVKGPTGAKITLCYNAPDDMDDEDYPIVTTLRLYASFKGVKEPRLLEKTIVIAKPNKRPPAPEPVLLPVPTFLRVTSRQPVKLVAGGSSTHVRLRWDGQDHLAIGSPPPWTFSARCATIENFPTIGFSKPRGGKFELLLDTPRGLLLGQKLAFEIDAIGPNGEVLSTDLEGIVVAPPTPEEPRKIKDEAPDPRAQRKPPYELKYVKEPHWDQVRCWGEPSWTGAESGCFEEPTGTSPLILLINTDSTLLKEFRRQMVKRKLVEVTIKERVNRYTAHVAFHLYQMYQYQKQCRDMAAEDEEVRVPQDAELRSEVNRVAATLVRLMQVSA